MATENSLCSIVSTSRDNGVEFLIPKERVIALWADESSTPVLHLGDKNDKAKSAERRGRKATGPRFRQEATEGP